MILQGDARAIPLRSGSVHCVVTSPPYWGLRKYDASPQVWGGNSECTHDFGPELSLHKGGPHGDGVLLEGGRAVVGAQAEVKDVLAGAFCAACGAWRGQLGLEPSPELYVEHMVEVFAEVHRVLRDDGTLWLNMGDCYATGAGPVGQHPGGGEQGARWAGRGVHTVGSSGKAAPRIAAMGPMTQPNRMPQPGLKPKDLVGMPWRLAFALQAWGWWLRRDIIWAKGMSFCPAYSGSVMPESVKDRPTSAHEYVFILTKAGSYFYDHAAIREPAVRADEFKYDPGTDGHHGGLSHKGSGASTRRFQKQPAGWNDGPTEDDKIGRYSPRPGTRAMPPQPGEPNAFHEVGRNVRSVWAITTQPFPEAHFATFPEALVEPCVLAGTSERGCCPRCGAPWRRLVRERLLPTGKAARTNVVDARDYASDGNDQGSNRQKDGHVPGWARADETIGWAPTCGCGAEPVKTLVLDPFSGSGTVALVCNRLGRRGVGLELSPAYCRMASRRSAQIGLL